MGQKLLCGLVPGSDLARLYWQIFMEDVEEVASELGGVGGVGGFGMGEDFSDT